MSGADARWPLGRPSFGPLRLVHGDPDLRR
jgi:hypothetical protein